MPGPQGFDRFETAARGSRRGRRIPSASGPPAPGEILAATRSRLGLLAVISVAVAIAAYAGPGLASGEPDRSGRPAGSPDKTSATDQYDAESRPDARRETGPRRTPPEPERAPAPSRPGPSPDSTGVTGSVAASGAAEARPQSRSATPAPYNARSYCRTLERRPPPRAPGQAQAVFPLPEKYYDSYDDTWGAARPQGGHEGADMMSPAGTPEYAVTDGTVVRVAGSNANGWNRLGGYAVMLRADYGVGPVKKGDLFYYTHMDRKSSLRIGQKVEAGDQVGVAGDTGYGGEGTRGKFPSHLHLGWYDTTGKTSELPSGAMNPYPLLEWLKRNGGTAAGGWGSREAASGYCDYQERAAKTPAPDNDDQDHGPRPSRSSGASADLYTGSPDPSPVAQRGTQPDRPQGEQDAATPRQTRVSPPVPEAPASEKPRGGRAGDEAGNPGQTDKRAKPPENGDEREPERPAPEPESPEPREPAERGSILPLAYQDEDADGRRDAGEPKLTGWRAELERAGAKSFGSGSGVRVEDLPSGVYKVTVKTPDGYLRTTPGTARVRLGEGRDARPEFGFVEPARISVSSCGDDQPCEAGEGSLSRWSVRLLDEQDRPVAADEAGRGGEPEFTDLRPGVYRLSLSPPGGSGLAPVSRRLKVSGGESWAAELRMKGSAPLDQYSEREAREPSISISRDSGTQEKR